VLEEYPAHEEVKDEEGGDEENQLVMSSHHLYPKQLYTKNLVGLYNKCWIKNKRRPCLFVVVRISITTPSH
jgi:hypothetical protein